MRFSVFGEHDAWEISLGEGPPSLGFVMHADVVPVREAGDTAPLGAGTIPPGWSVPPFEALVKDGALWGRGTEDDKGPIAAVLVAMAALARAEVRPQGRVVAIIGTAEESDWDGMIRYTKTATKPAHVISIDASFPVVVAESGFVGWRLESEEPRRDASRPRIVSAKAGQFLTQVPGEARMRVTAPDLEALATTARRLLDAERARRGAPFGGEVELEDGAVRISTRGEAVHSSVADEGHNALWMLAAIAKGLEPGPSPAASLLAVLAEHFDGDHHGERLGLRYEHPLMGPLLVIPTLFEADDAKASLGINMRRPAGKSRETFAAELAALAGRLAAADPSIRPGPDPYVGEPALADTTGPLVPTLMEIYRAQTGDTKSEPISIRGGTYARLFPGAVSFGPAMPDEKYSGHAPDERIALSTLEATLRMCFEAMLRLATTPGS